MDANPRLLGTGAPIATDVPADGQPGDLVEVTYGGALIRDEFSVDL